MVAMMEMLILIRFPSGKLSLDRLPFLQCPLWPHALVAHWGGDHDNHDFDDHGGDYNGNHGYYHYY